MHPKITYDFTDPCAIQSTRVLLETEYMWAEHENQWLLDLYRAYDDESLMRAIARIERTWSHYSIEWWLD